MASALFPSDESLAAMLTASLPACRDARARVHRCHVREVITGRRGKLFALAEAEVVHLDGAAGATTRGVILQRYPEGVDAVEEGRKVYRRLRRFARERGVRKSLSPWAGFIREERLLVLPFPFDYRLPALVDACDTAVVAARFRAAGLARTVRAIVPVRYVPEKRCQIRYEIEDAAGAPGALFGKVVADESGARAVVSMRTLHAALRDSPVAGTPEPVAYLPEWRMVVQRAVPGRTLYDLQREGAVDGVVYLRAGAALALVHRTPVPELPVHDTTHELALLATAIGKHALAPSVEAEAGLLLAQLRTTATHLGTQPLVTSHRDFYDKQLLWGDRGLWLIDLDTLARAPQALDAGNFLAHLRLRRRQGYLSPEQATQASGAFLYGFASGHRADRAALHWWTAASLLRLATIYAVRPGWEHLGGQLVVDAAESLWRSGLAGTTATVGRSLA